MTVPTKGAAWRRRYTQHRVSRFGLQVNLVFQVLLASLVAFLMVRTKGDQSPSPILRGSLMPNPTSTNCAWGPKKRMERALGAQGLRGGWLRPWEPWGLRGGWLRWEAGC